MHSIRIRIMEHNQDITYMGDFTVMEMRNQSYIAAKLNTLIHHICLQIQLELNVPRLSMAQM